MSRSRLFYNFFTSYIFAHYIFSPITFCHTTVVVKSNKFCDNRLFLKLWDSLQWMKPQQNHTLLTTPSHYWGPPVFILFYFISQFFFFNDYKFINHKKLKHNTPNLIVFWRTLKSQKLQIVPLLPPLQFYILSSSSLLIYNNN